tara:strand:+ start:691 stop:2133 length:1443 start_codon:yes stop_codon:yes gene_type:complete
MILSKRIIARLDLKGNKLIKGIRFEGLRVIGDPYEAAIKYFKNGADEILYLDAVASLYGRNSLKEVLRKTCKEIFIPITAGGGIRSLDDVTNLLSAGADKIAINTAAVENPSLIKEISDTYGSQCVVISIQARRNQDKNFWEVMTCAGREKTGKNVIDWIIESQKMGAGEILLTSIDKDGTCLGPDIELINEVNKIIEIPFIIGGGFASDLQVKKEIFKSKVSAISIGTALHKDVLKISLLKESLLRDLINIRKNNSQKKFNIKNSLKNIKIGIIDYGMGNQQSLINALDFLGAKVKLSNNRSELESMDILALPGVGSFPEGIKKLKKNNLDEFLKNKSIDGFPLIGICLGMQILFEKGEEIVPTFGLGLIKGEVKLLPKFNKNSEKVKLPHIGWNIIKARDKSMIFSNIYQYFVHSYAVEADNHRKSKILYTSQYGDKEFIAVIRYKNTIGFQFHPERSGFDGLNILSQTIIELINSKI